MSMTSPFGDGNNSAQSFSVVLLEFNSLACPVIKNYEHPTKTPPPGEHPFIPDCFMFQMVITKRIICVRVVRF